jgi:hypothetical protein
MSKILCKCGNTLTISGEIPNPDEWLLISDVDYDSFSETVDAEELYLRMKSMFKCRRCGRLWIYWEDLKHAPTCYSLET